MRREVHSNYRLVITPDLYLRGKHAIAKALLDEMAVAVRRHVDNVEHVKAVWDTRAECSFCGREWEVVTFDDLTSRAADYEGCVVGEPVCCTKAAEEFRAEHAQAPSEPGGRS